MDGRWIIRLLFQIGAVFAVNQISAQTFVWSVPPQDCSEMKRINSNLYQVICNGKIGLVKPDGTVVVDAVCTEITPFYENKALLISRENEKERILGIITFSGDCCMFSRTYYALSGQAFYSEGLLSVENEDGVKGYIDEKGFEVIGFQSHFTTIKPFCEGYAAVFLKKEYALIDKYGKKMPMIIGIGKVHGGTNVFNDEAVIWDTEGKFYSYNTKTRKCKSIHRPQSTQVDYLYCFSELSKRNRNVPYTKMSSGVVGLTPTLSNGKYGFWLNGSPLIPAQFDSATSVEDGYAVVSINGKCGILKYIDSADAISVSIPKAKIDYLSGKNVECAFSLNLPDIYKGRKIDVLVRDDSMNLPLSIQENSYSFKYKPKRNNQSFLVDIKSEGMILKSDTLSYTFVRKAQELQISISVNNVEADTNGKVWVTATVRNPNDDNIQTTLTMTGGPAKFMEISKTVTVAANSSVTIKSCFFDINKEYANQHVKVHASSGGIVTKNNITVKPNIPTILKL